MGDNVRNAIILQQKKKPLWQQGECWLRSGKIIFPPPELHTKRKKNQLNRGLAQLQFSTRFRATVLKCIELCNCVCVFVCQSDWTIQRRVLKIEKIGKSNRHQLVPTEILVFPQPKSSNLQPAGTNVNVFGCVCVCVCGCEDAGMLFVAKHLFDLIN